MIKLADLQGLRTALHLNDHSYFHGPNIDDAILEALDYLIDAKTELEDPDKHLGHRVRFLEHLTKAQADQIESLQQINQQLRAFVAILHKPRDVDHYKRIIAENALGKTAGQWADVIRVSDIKPEEKEILLKYVESRFEGAMAQHGDLDDVLDD